ncbi:MAG: hypothetical protein QNJ29_13975 [Rhizobiaceae bacterium]|nr:hypothetical protein [Rhizobiaceae bacterium]
MTKILEYKRGYTDAIRHVVEDILKRSEQMNDPNAKAVLRVYADILGNKGAQIRRRQDLVALKSQVITVEE